MMHLDRVFAPFVHVITGVRFKVDTSSRLTVDSGSDSV